MRDGRAPREPARGPARAGDGALATALMAGIVMDTATFAHPNATPRTLAVSAALVEAGAPLSDISRRLYRSKPDAQLRLFGRVLDRIEHVDDGRVLWSTLTEGDLATTGTRRGALGGHHRPARPGRAGRGRDPVQGAGLRDADQRPHEARRGRRHGAHRGRSAAAGTPGPPGRPSIARSTRPARSSWRRPAGWPPRSAERGPRGRRAARARRDPRRRQAGRPDLARRRRPRPAAGRHAPGRSRRHPRPLRDRRPAAVPRPGDPARRVPPR